jgi:uncharacterized protein YjdB
LGDNEWGQNDPFFGQTPEIDGEHCAVGCVATAMAMIMNYYKWPEKTLKPIPTYTTGSGMSLPELPVTTFEWEAMKSSYKVGETGPAVDAVAKLMRYCGQAVEMGYAVGNSASSGICSKELVEYFGYDPQVYVANRTLYTTQQWESLIYGELAAGRPVLYAGQSGFGVGHEFVCDGYDGEGFFHINWGWEGSRTGYFLLSLLDDCDQYATEGVVNWGGYANAHIRLMPNRDGSTKPLSPTLSQSLRGLTPTFGLATITCDRSGTSADVSFPLYMMLFNNTLSDGSKSPDLVYGLGLYQKGECISVLTQTDVAMGDPSFEWNPEVTFGKDLVTGRYAIKAMWRCKGDGDEWRLFPESNETYVQASVEKEKITLSIHDPDDCDYTVSDVRHDGTLYQKGYHQFWITATNHGEKGTIHFNMYIDDEMIHTSNATIDPGETSSFLFHDVWFESQELGKHELRLCAGGYNRETNVVWKKEIEIVDIKCDVALSSLDFNAVAQENDFGFIWNIIEGDHLEVKPTLKSISTEVYENYLLIQIYKKLRPESDEFDWYCVRREHALVSVAAGEEKSIVFEFDHLDEGTYMIDVYHQMPINGIGRFSGFEERSVDSRSFFKVVDHYVPVKSITLNAETLEMKVGESSKLTATVLPDDATAKGFKWTSTDKGVATVDAEGVVWANSVGKAVIKAESLSNPVVSASCEVTVVDDDGILVLETRDMQNVRAIYDITGRKVEHLQHGIYILLLDDGTTNKVIKSIMR